MAREHARVKLSIWEDDDFRNLSGDAQRLYFVLLTSLKLDYCGVTDWRPVRIAPLCANWTVQDVERAAEELSEGLYIVIDEETEEALLRSFVRNDELLESPNMAVAMRKAHAAISSAALRQIVIHELNRLKIDKPQLKGWERVSDMLDRASLDPSEYPSFKASVNPSARDTPIPSGNRSLDPSLTTAPNSLLPTPATATPSGSAQKRGVRIERDWKPTDRDIEWQRSKSISDFLARRELEKFINYWTAKSGKDAAKRDWSATWRNWLLNAQEREPKQAAGSGGSYLKPWQ